MTYYHRLTTSKIVSQCDAVTFVKNKIEYEGTYNVVSDIICSHGREFVIDNITDIVRDFIGFRQEVQEAFNRLEISVNVPKSEYDKGVMRVITSRYFQPDLFKLLRAIIEYSSKVEDYTIVTCILRQYDTPSLVDNYKSILKDFKVGCTDSITSIVIRSEIDFNVFRNRGIDVSQLDDPSYRISHVLSCKL